MAAAVEQSLSVALEPCASSLPSASSRTGQGYRGVFKVPSLVFDIEVSRQIRPRQPCDAAGAGEADGFQTASVQLFKYLCLICKTICMEAVNWRENLNCLCFLAPPPPPSCSWRTGVSAWHGQGMMPMRMKL